MPTDAHTLTQPGFVAALLALAALILFAVGHRLSRTRRWAPDVIRPQKARRMMALADAAEKVHGIATRERLAIAHVADGSGDPASWFEQSIASVVAIYERREEKGAFRKAVEVGTDTQSLYIQKRDFQTYLRWARSMQ